MEKIELNEESLKYLNSHKPLQIGDWTAACTGQTFKLNNHGIKLWARDDEVLEKIIFDTKEKTVSVIVKKPTLPTKAPRIVGLSESLEFFEELRKEIENILTTKGGTYTKVNSNADRTVFEIS